MISRPWPSARDYCEAIVDRSSLSSFKLRRGTLELSPGGLPKAYSGTSATTFRFTTMRGDVALRCFTRGCEHFGQRYAAISELLQYARIDALCQTQYVPEGMRVAGNQWPVVMMDWVPGLALNAEIESRLGDGDAMLALAMEFRDVMRSLGAVGIAHGDLQHGNILVSGGRLRLIDYDAMYLPAIADLPQFEYGHRNYQHPARRSARFDSRLDRFSSIVIYTALIALSSDRSLWTRFNDGENLLFRAHDFTSHDDSELFRTLLANNATSSLARILLTACQTPIEKVPTLEHAIQIATGIMPARLPLPFGSDSVWRSPHNELVLPQRRVARPAETLSSVPARQPSPRSPDAALRWSIARNRFARFPALSGRVGSVIVVAGLAIGFAVAIWQHDSRSPISFSQNLTVAAREPSPVRVRAAVAKPMPTAAAGHAAAATPVSVALPTADVRPVKRKSYSRLQGAWQITEANLRVGTIVWSGVAALSHGGTIVLDTHKASVADQWATPCERRTTLHAAIAVGVAQQIVRYVETNCGGTTSRGEIRVTSFTQDAASFLGTVWQGGVKLGDFTASKQLTAKPRLST